MAQRLRAEEVYHALALKVSERVNEYIEKKRCYEGELEHDLTLLKEMYGRDLVEMVIQHGGVDMNKRKRGRPPRGSATAEPMAGGQPSFGQTNRPKVADLRVAIDKVLPEFKGRTFTRADVEARLKQDKVENVNYSHTSTILRTHNDLVSIGKTDSLIGGAPLNIYKFKDDVVEAPKTV